MLEDFLNGKLYIKITEQDISLLSKLQDEINIVFKSGESLCGNYAVKLINYYSVIYITAEEGSVFYTNHIEHSVSLSEFLYGLPIQEIQDNEIMNLFEV